MARALMLDVDGVLVVPRDPGGWAAGLEGALGIAPERLRDHFFHPCWPEIVTGRRALMPVLTEVLGRIAPHVTAAALRDYWFAQDSEVVPEVLADVAALRAEGVPVWLATNQEHARAAYLMETVGLRDHVDGMIHSAAVGARKPDRAFFEACEAIAGPCLLVDDTPQNVRVAAGLGWPVAVWPDAGGLAGTVRRLQEGMP